MPKIEQQLGNPGSEAFFQMDRIYRFQRHFYDLTRKYYLLGRDQLIEEMDVKDGESVLEVGCGTGRNLIKIAQRSPGSLLFGIDASAAMLKTATENTRAVGAENVRLVRALADEISYERTLGLECPFDKIFFSFSLSMIPPWRESLVKAFDNLQAQGSIYIVDFCDQTGLPKWFRKGLTKWLELFHVRLPSDLIELLKKMNQDPSLHIDYRELYRGYSFIAKVSKV